MVENNLLLSEANEKILSRLDNTIGLGELKEKIREMIRYHEVMQKHKCNIDFENYNIVLRKTSSYSTHNVLLSVISEIFYKNKITLNPQILKISGKEVRDRRFNEKKYKTFKEGIIFIDVTEGFRNVADIKDKINEMVEAMPTKVFIIMENDFTEGEANALLVDYFSWYMKIDEISKEEKEKYIKDFFERNGLICSEEKIEELADNPYYEIKNILITIFVNCKIAKTKNVDRVLKDEEDDIEGKVREKSSKKTGIKELDSLVGLDDVKTQIKKVINYIRISKSRNKLPMLHMCFNGNPGTGKTTVARIVGRIFAEENILSNNNIFFEAQRSDLIGKYVGQTAPQTQKIIDKCLGGVLFIDEAYTLGSYIQDEGGRDYGAECIATLLKGMEDYRDSLCVILAGYTKEMEHLLSVNPGFESRIQFIINFPDYTAEELYIIFKDLCKKENYKISSNIKKYLVEHFEQARKNKNFANARYVRSLFEKIKIEQADRVANNEQNVDMIVREDVEKSIKVLVKKEEKSKMKIGFVA